MTSQVRSLSLQPDFSQFWRRILVLALMLVLVAGAAWLALSPTTVLDMRGAVTRTWADVNAAGQPSLYWVEITDQGQARRCSVAAYQTQLVDAWQELAPGMQATMTCYGQSAVSLAAAP